MPPLEHLSATHRTALEAATAFVVERYAPWAVVAAGTVIRGTPDRYSDIDLYVLHDAPYRQRVQRFFRNIPVEIFVNTEASVSRYLAEEEKDGHLFTAHMLATGVVIQGMDEPRLADLRARAQESLEGRPNWSHSRKVRSRYEAATMIEDAIDCHEADASTAMRFLNRGVDAAITVWFEHRGHFIPRQKEILERIDVEAPELAHLLHVFWGDYSYDDRWDAGMAISDRILGTRGFFEWESDRESVE
jgi:hypothetical protein